MRDLQSRLFRWRVGVRWYALALLTVPLLTTAILGALSLTSNAFLPTIITTGDNASLLAAGLVLALVASFFEEIGWTGFATAELSKRHGLLATGLIVGLPSCVLHVPLYAQPPVGPSLRRWKWPCCSSPGCCRTGCSWCGSTTVPRAC